MTLSDDLVALVFPTMMAFLRMGTALAFMPAFGEVRIPMRLRLLMALVLSMTLSLSVPVPAEPPAALSGLAAAIVAETAIGAWIGLSARILMSSLQFAGYQVGMISGLSNAMAPDSAAFQGSTIVASLLLVGGVALIFVTETHHMILLALAGSYDVFPFGTLWVGDMAEQMVRVGAGSLKMGLSIAAPFFVMSVVLNVAMGLANRMMPTLAVFFVAGPALILICLLILVVATPSMIGTFLGQFQSWLATFVLQDL